MTELKQKIVDAGNKAGVKGLVKQLFDVELTPLQAKIVEDIAFERERRLILNTYTQYGKTMVTGIGLALLILRYNNRELHIGSLGPRFDDAEGPRKEMIDKGLNFELTCPTCNGKGVIEHDEGKEDCFRCVTKGYILPFGEMMDTSRGNDPEDMKSSANKDMLTFNDGDIKFEVMSAASGSGQDDNGEGLMGEGVDILVMDESNRIPHTVWMDSADRLLNKYDATLVEMGNPKHQNNQFFEHWQSPKFKKYHAGEKKLHEYEDAYIPDNLVTASGVEEGRHQERFFDEKAENVGGRDTVRFAWKYKSTFPDQVEGGLISKSWIRDAQDRILKVKKPNVIYAQDIADEGDDLIVLARFEEQDNKWRLTDQWAKQYSNDTAKTAVWAADIIYKKEVEGEVNSVLKDIGKSDIQSVEEKVLSNDVTSIVERAIIDYTGIGGGVWSKLNELGFNAIKFKSSEKPVTKQDKYVNKKARNYFKLKNMLQEGNIEFVEGYRNRHLDMPENKLVYQLGHMKRTEGRAGKDKVEDPNDKSPDFADSLMMAVYEPNTGFVL